MSVLMKALALDKPGSESQPHCYWLCDLERFLNLCVPELLHLKKIIMKVSAPYGAIGKIKGDV